MGPEPTYHLAPVPGSDWALLLGMVKVIVDDDAVRLPEEAKVAGFAELADCVRAVDLADLASICDVSVDEITTVARGFARSRRGFVLAGTGPALGVNGTLAQWLALVLNVITDRIERPGGRFMPNWPVPWEKRFAQSGKSPTRTSRVRGLPVVAGSRALAEMPDEILTPGEGQIRALIIGGGNPVSTGPDGARLEQALDSLDLLVSLDLFQRETHRQADWLVPALHFLEREEVHIGLHAYNEKPFIQTTRRVLEPPPEIRPEWMFYRDLSARLGKPLFGGQDMSPERLAAVALDGGGMITFDKVQASDHGVMYGERTIGHLWDMLRTNERPVQLWPEEFVARLRHRLGEGVRPRLADFRLISRRRNGMMNASLAESSGSVHPDETADTVEMSVADAEMLSLADRDRVVIRSRTSSLETEIVVSQAVRPGTLVMAHGWGSPLYDPASGIEVFRKGNARNRLVGSAEVDDCSGVPQLNGTVVQIERVVQKQEFAWSRTVDMSDR